MKKILSLTMAAAMALSLAACGNTAEAPAEESATTNSATSEAAEGGETSVAIAGIAQVCDVGTIDDESFNQGCWEAVEAYGEANGIDVQLLPAAGRPL